MSEDHESESFERSKRAVLDRCRQTERRRLALVPMLVDCVARAASEGDTIAKLCLDHWRTADDDYRLAAIEAGEWLDEAKRQYPQ